MLPTWRIEPITNNEYFEYLILRNMSLKHFNVKYPELPQSSFNFKLVDSATQKEYFITKPTLAMNNAADTSSIYMNGYFSMRHGKPNEKRWQQVTELMEKNNIEQLELRVYASFLIMDLSVSRIYTHAFDNIRRCNLTGSGLKKLNDEEIEEVIKNHNNFYKR